MQLVPQINLPGRGVRVPIITGDPEADWVQAAPGDPRNHAENGTVTRMPSRGA